MYNFELADFDLKGGQAPNVASIRCVDKKYVEIEYMNGRKVRYIYNPTISEKRVVQEYCARRTAYIPSKRR